MAILVTDTTIWTMDDEFGLLVARDTLAASMACCCVSCTEVARWLPAPLTAQTVLMRNNMLILPAAMALLQWNYGSPSQSAGLSMAARCSTNALLTQTTERPSQFNQSRRKTHFRCLARQQCIRACVPVQHPRNMRL